MLQKGGYNMKEKRWRILWINNQVSNVAQSGGQPKDSHREKQKYPTLKPYVRFLEYQGYEITLTDADPERIALLTDETYHAVLLSYDETTREDNLLARIRKVDAHIPIILLTFEEDVEVMQQASLYDVDSIFMMPASGQVETTSKQLALSLEFMLEKQAIREAYTPQAYVQNFNRTYISGGEARRRTSGNDWQTWIDTYRHLVEWELRLDTLHNVDELKTIHEMEKRRQTPPSPIIFRITIDTGLRAKHRLPCLWMSFINMSSPKFRPGNRCYLSLWTVCGWTTG